MSDATQSERPPYPGEAWTEIVRRPTLEEFSRAFASDVVLEASVLSRPIVGPARPLISFRSRCCGLASAETPRNRLSKGNDLIEGAMM
jgi:hypothetical protein